MREIKFDIMQKIGDSYIHKTMTLDEIAKTKNIGSDWDNCIKRLCTGLIDKNKVEICVGDIVSNGDILVIKWESTQVGINGSEYGSGYTGFVARESRDNDNEIAGISQTFLFGNYGDTSIYADRLEVIGNIYENPELLVQK